MAEITYICKRTVVSTKPVPPGKHHDLSVLDRLMEKKHLKIVFYYPSTGEMNVAGEMTRRLCESLSEMLNDFPMVTGRLVKKEEGKWMIKCNDAGVRMVEARAKGSVEEWLKSANREMEFKLVYWEEMYHLPYFWSPFYVQITEFEGGGLAVGLSCHHLLADPICATMFIKTWADTTSAQTSNGPLPLHLHPSPINKAQHHTPPNPLINYYKSSIEKLPPPTNSNHKTIALAFTDEEVRACMSLAQDAGPAKSSPSPFAALAGLFWAGISKVRGARKNQFVNMSICLDRRTTLQLENNTFGNYMVCNKVEAEDNEESRISTAIQAVAKAAAEMDDKDRIVELIEWLECNDDKSGTLNNDSDLVCVSLEESGDAYLAAFEGRVAPVRMSCYVEPVGDGGQVLIMRPPSGDGRFSRVVMATVTDVEAVRLLEDDDLVRLHPTILIGLDD